MTKEIKLQTLIEKYSLDLVEFTIRMDELTTEECEDLEYLEDRVQTHLEHLPEFYKSNTK